MKALVRKCAGYLGYEIRKIHRPPAAAGLRGPSAVHHNSRPMREQFYEDSSQVESYLSAERRQFYRDVVALLKANLPKLEAAVLRVADYGCGPGLLLRELGAATPGSEFHGYDFTLSGLAIARETFPQARFEQRDIFDAYPDRFDVILCTEVLEHLERPYRALKNLLKQLEPGGILLCTVPDGRVDQYAGHIHFWSPESWTIFVEDNCAGFDVRTGSVGAPAAPAFLYALIVAPGRRGGA